MGSTSKTDVLTILTLAVLGVAAFGSLVALLRSSRPKSVRVQCLSNLKQIGALCISYADDHKDWLPYDPSPRPRAFAALQVLVDSCTEFEPRVLISPAHHDRVPARSAYGGYVLSPSNVSYTYRPEPTTSTAPPNTILLTNNTYRGAPNQGAEPEGHEGGVNAVLITGEAKFIHTDEWAKDRSFPAGLVDNYGNGD